MSDGYESMGYASADEYFTLRGYYQELIGEYVREQSTHRGFIGELLGICLGHDHHEKARLAKDLCIDILSLLADPEISSRLESHLRPKAGKLLKMMAEVFDEAQTQEFALDLISVDHDCPKSFFTALDEKYSRLYEEAGMCLPDIPAIPVQLRKAS